MIVHVGFKQNHLFRHTGQIEPSEEERSDRRRRALRIALKNSGLNLRTAAMRCGVHATALGNFLNGHAASLSLETLEPLALGLGITLDELVGGGETMSNEPLKLTATTVWRNAPNTERIVKILLGEAAQRTSVAFDLATDGQIIIITAIPAVAGGAAQLTDLITRILQSDGEEPRKGEFQIAARPPLAREQRRAPPPQSADPVVK